MSINKKLQERNGELCELCNSETAMHEYTVSPKNDEFIENQVALCNTCLEAVDSKEASFHWRCVEGSIWSVEPSVQALSYRILQNYKEEDWANTTKQKLSYYYLVKKCKYSIFKTCSYGLVL